MLAATLVLLLQLLLAAPGVLPALVGKALKPLVVLVQVDRRTAPGVHHLFLRDLGGGLLDGGGLGLLLLFRLLFAALSLGTVLLFCLVRLGGGLGLRLGDGLLFHLGLVVDVGIDRLDGGDLIVLGQVFEDEGQLLVGEGLHMVFGRVAILGQDVHDLLGG